MNKIIIVTLSKILIFLDMGAGGPKKMDKDIKRVINDNN